MSVDSNQASGQTEQVSDTQGENQEHSGETKTDTVDYKTYFKTVNEVKKEREKRRELESKLNEILEGQKKVEEEKLKEQGEYKKLLQSREEELKMLKNKTLEYEQTLTNGQKMSEFMSKLPGKIKRKEYYSFIPVDEIVIDPETGTVDERTLDTAVNSFLENHRDLLDIRKGNSIPHDAGQPKSSLTMEQWKSLPIAEKRKRYNEVMQNYKNKS